MANGDIYQVIDTSTFQGQKMINVYFYRWDSVVVTGDADTLADEFIANVLPKVCAIQIAQVVHTQIDVNNLFNPSDRTTRAISEPGTGAIGSVDFLPIFNAVNFSLVQDNGAIRNGSKRYGGLVESWQTSGVITDSNVLTWLQDLADQLKDALLNGVVDTFFPVVVGRILDGTSYRLPANAGEAVFGGITDAVFDALISSQVSRKIGTGE